MTGVELVMLLLAASAGLRILAERWRIPYATLLVLGGLVLALIPRASRVTLSPDVLFLIFVPPLLYWGAVQFPLRDLRRSSGPILRLAVLMVLVTMGAVAAVVRAIDPAFTWAAAFTLGAIVAPPDPVAVLSLMRWVRLPRDIERILEGEGLLNDATALVAYRMAVGAAVTGAFSPWHGAVQFVLVSAGGIIVGLALGAAAIFVHRLTRAVDVAEITVSLLTPFAVYLAGEWLHVSGVVAVVTTAMYVARNPDALGSPSTRVESADTWSTVTFLLESLVFILIGIELPYVVRDLNGSAVSLLLREAVVVCVCVIGVRMLWVFPSALLGRRIDRLLRQSDEPRPTWRQLLFIGWAGVRGGDSLVIALALPLTTAAGQPFPARDRIIFLTFCVILLTLVLQGPTLRPLAHWLRLAADGGVEDEEAHARLTAAEAGLRALDAATEDGHRYPEVARYLRQRHRQRARRWASREHDRFRGRGEGTNHGHSVSSPPSHESGQLDERRAEVYRRIRSTMIRAERDAVVALRDSGAIADDVMRTVERELDLEQMLLDSGAPVVEPPTEVRVV